ncbi:MAG: DNA translocase FtsK 4TM domain-containing protein [Lentisphaeria bacterium]|nr:DNA translocase FtsK 4TM domain-containing protein [Lentisphaeria bacterium]
MSIRARREDDFEKNNTAEFKLRYIVLLLLAVFVLLALLTYSPEDANSIYGGTNALPENWIGPVGAKFSWYMLVNFGLSSYIIAFMLLLRSIRLFMASPGRTVKFIYGTLLIWGGILLLFGLEPVIFTPVAANLNLGRMDVPELSIPGGVIGQFLAAPPSEGVSAGILTGTIGAIGTMVCGWILVVAGITVVYISDWYGVVRQWMLGGRNADDEYDDDEEEDEEEDSGFFSRWRRRSRVVQDEYEDEDYDDDADGEEEPPAPVRRSRLSAVAEGAGDVEPGKGKHLSRLRDIFRLDEEESETEKEDELAAASAGKHTVELFDDEDDVEDGDDVEAAFAAASRVSGNVTVPVSAPSAAAAIQDTPEVSTKVVQQGEKLRGEVGDFVLPPITMLAQGTNIMGESSDAIELASNKIQQTLDDFGIAGRVTGFVSGPRVTRYEITLEPGINVKKVEQIQDNIRMALAATSIRVLAPIPGRSVVGIEVSNTRPEAVFMRSVMESEEWKNGKAEIPLALGKNVSGKPVILDLAKAPHMLVAGATGTGKSVCSNSLIMSMLFRFRPDELRLIMVDPKIVEFDAYKKLPHLLTPIINDSSKVPIALRWAANEMDRRYHVLAQVGVKKLSEFNNRPLSAEPEFDKDGHPIPDKMPLLVIILDELADLMMTEAKKDVETNITRIAQKGRAAGIHIIVATQRPSTNIITGVIKANLPTRLCFQVRSLVDSRVVLDTPGAEKLLGMGDMLVMTSSSMEIERVQGAWVKDDDIKKVVQFISEQAPQRFNDNVLTEPDDAAGEEIDEDYEAIDNDDRADIAPIIKKYMQPDDDDTFRRALEVVILDRKASTSYLQRRLKIGYNRAAEIVDQMEERGIVGPPSGSGNKRDILVFDGFDKGE